MANFHVAGFDAVEQALLREEQTALEAVPEMLKAGAEVLANEQKAQIEAYNLVDKGALIRSIKADKIKGEGTGRYVEVYPHGKDKKGVRNAEKAFIAQYGRTRQPAKPWFTTANEKAAPAVHEAMMQVWRDKHK